MKIHCAHDAEVAIEDLKPNPANPNKHPDSQIALLAKIIKAQGWRNPIVVSNRSGLITKGHGRLAAALTLGATHAPVDYQDYASEKEELADMIADNRIAELAEADRSMLRELAEQLDDGSFDMDLTGFDQDALEELMTAAPPDSDIDAEPQIDKAEELRKKWGVERGQIWELGEHRIMCGDCTRDSILNGDKAAVTICDPPYGVTTEKWDRLPNDHDLKLWLDFSIGAVIAFGAARTDCLTALLNLKPQPERVYIWWNTFTLTSSENAFWQWQPIYVWRRDKMSGMQRDVIDMAANTGGDPKSHPTQKPTALLAKLIDASTKHSQIVYDPFSGSGTIIIACEQLGRKCRAMEIDPGYVAVSIQRWADATGKTPKLLTSFPNQGKDAKKSKSRKKA